MIRTCTIAALLIGALVPRVGDGQQLPFAVTIVVWDSTTLERQRRAFRSEAGEHEVLYCVESWTTAASVNGLERITITGVRRERAGRMHRIDDVGSQCLGDAGAVLPMLHTHSDGNCQFSPSDLIAVVARAGPFEGVQCGDHHFIWAFAWQVVAIATSVEREQFRRAGTSRP